MDAALKAYATASDYGIADVTTEATFQVASLYQDFAKAIVESQRPKRLSKLEREQYDLMLEDQADPYVDKAIELHTLNAHRSAQGLWTDGMRKSFEALRTLQPARWNKVEHVGGSIDAIQ